MEMYFEINGIFRGHKKKHKRKVLPFPSCVQNLPKYIFVLHLKRR